MFQSPHPWAERGLMSLQLTFGLLTFTKRCSSSCSWSGHTIPGTATTWVSGTELVLTICFCGCF